MSESCTICGEPTRLRSHSDFRFRECRVCGYGQLDTDGRSDYWSPQHGSLDDEEYWAAAKLNYFDSALGLLGSMTAGRRLLDLGGGLGIFTERAVEKGWDAFTLDISPAAAEQAARRLGADRSLSSIDRVQPGSFDAVTMWCVVAHTRDPGALIHAAQRALKPGGVIWITTPNFSFQKPYAAVRKRLGRRLDFEREDHVGHFSPRAVRRLLANGGFIDVEFHFCGITETCVAARSQSRMLVEGKRLWNRLATLLLKLDANVMSELQVTGVKNPARELAGAASANDGRERQCEEPEIATQGEVLDVVALDGESFRERERATAEDLHRSREAGLHL